MYKDIVIIGTSCIGVSCFLLQLSPAIHPATSLPFLPECVRLMMLSIWKEVAVCWKANTTEV